MTTTTTKTTTTTMTMMISMIVQSLEPCCFYAQQFAGCWMHWLSVIPNFCIFLWVGSCACRQAPVKHRLLMYVHAQVRSRVRRAVASAEIRQWRSATSISTSAASSARVCNLQCFLQRTLAYVRRMNCVLGALHSTILCRQAVIYI